MTDESSDRVVDVEPVKVDAKARRKAEPKDGPSRPTPPTWLKQAVEEGITSGLPRGIRVEIQRLEPERDAHGARVRGIVGALYSEDAAGAYELIARRHGPGVYLLKVRGSAGFFNQGVRVEIAPDVQYGAPPETRSSSASFSTGSGPSSPAAPVSAAAEIVGLMRPLFEGFREMMAAGVESMKLALAHRPDPLADLKKAMELRAIATGEAPAHSDKGATVWDVAGELIDRGATLLEALIEARAARRDSERQLLAKARTTPAPAAAATAPHPPAAEKSGPNGAVSRRAARLVEAAQFYTAELCRRFRAGEDAARVGDYARAFAPDALRASIPSMSDDDVKALLREHPDPDVRSVAEDPGFLAWLKVAFDRFRSPASV